MSYKKRGTRRDFFRCIQQKSDGRQIWMGNTTTNHNTVDCEKYEYGHYELLEDVRSNLVKPRNLVNTKLVHRQMVFLTFGVDLSREFEVFALNGNRLDITPSNLAVRHISTGLEKPAMEFFAANDNRQQAGRKAA